MSKGRQTSSPTPLHPTTPIHHHHDRAPQLRRHLRAAPRRPRGRQALGAGAAGAPLALCTRPSFPAAAAGFGLTRRTQPHHPPSPANPTCPNSTPPSQFCPSRELKNTLLHEMIHAKLFLDGRWRADGDHGPLFK